MLQYTSDQCCTMLDRVFDPRAICILQYYNFSALYRHKKFVVQVVGRTLFLFLPLIGWIYILFFFLCRSILRKFIKKVLFGDYYTVIDDFFHSNYLKIICAIFQKVCQFLLPVFWRYAGIRLRGIDFLPFHISTSDTSESPDDLPARVCSFHGLLYKTECPL